MKKKTGKSPALLGLILFLLMSSVCFPQKSPQDGGDREKDPYLQISREMNALSASLSHRKQTARVLAKGSSLKSPQRSDQTDFLFKVFKAWREFIWMENIRSTVKAKLRLLSRIPVVSKIFGSKTFFPALVALLLIIEGIYLFYTGKLDLETFLRSFIYAAFVFVLVLGSNYEKAFSAVDRGFKEITAYVVKTDPHAWKDATDALLFPLFKYFGANPAGALASVLLSVFLIIPLYFVYFPAITMPALVANLLILGLYLIGKFVLAFSVLSEFRSLAKNFLLSLVTLELYIFVYAVLFLAIGLSVRSALKYHFSGGDSLASYIKLVYGWTNVEVLLFIGPLTALFVMIDVMSYNVVRGVISGFFTSSGFGRVSSGTGSMGFAAASSAVGTGLFVATKGKSLGIGGSGGGKSGGSGSGGGQTKGGAAPPPGGFSDEAGGTIKITPSGDFSGGAGKDTPSAPFGGGAGSSYAGGGGKDTPSAPSESSEGSFEKNEGGKKDTAQPPEDKN